MKQTMEDKMWDIFVLFEGSKRDQLFAIHQYKQLKFLPSMATAREKLEEEYLKFLIEK